VLRERIGHAIRLAKKIFLLRFIEVFDGERGGFYIED